MDCTLDAAEAGGRWCLMTETPAQCGGAANHTERQLWTNASGGTPARNGALVADWDG